MPLLNAKSPEVPLWEMSALRASHAPPENRSGRDHGGFLARTALVTTDRGEAPVVVKRQYRKLRATSSQACSPARRIQEPLEGFAVS